MPHYDYYCTHCKHQLETFQKISDEPLKECTQCHQPTLKRKPGGGIGLRFQGSGFYITDYGSQSSACEKKTKTSSEKGSSVSSCCPCQE
jgi:putative FmdB family regulatory protein